MLVAAGTAQASSTWCSNSTTTTTWEGGSGNWGTSSSNWSNGFPNGDCAAVIDGNVTVTLTTTPDQAGYTDDGVGVAGLTLSGGATLVVEGSSANADGNWSNQTDLGVGTGGVSIASGSTLALDASDNSVDTPVAPEQPGGTAQLILTNSSAAPVTNNGTIVAENSDASYDEVMNFGGTLTNNGTIDAESGTLDFSGASPYMIVTNPGTIDVSSGATVAMQAGNGSSFTNTGQYTNDGSTWAGGSMDWVAGGSESGNPIQLQNYAGGGPTLVDSASGGAGSYLFDLGGGYMQGTIPSGQTVELQGFTYNCSGNPCNNTVLNLGNGIVTNDGTLVLDAPGSGTTTGGVSTLTYGTVDNYGTVESTVEDSNYHNEMQVALNNEAGGTVKVIGGTLDQEQGWTATNSGLWQVEPGATYELYGGSFTNDSGGTLQPQISGSDAYGVIDPVVGTFTAGGTLAPELTSGYVPGSGAEFPIFPLNGGQFTGQFASTTGGFSADYSHETVTTGTPYVGVVYAGTSSGAGAPGGGTGTSSAKPRATAFRGGAGEIKLTVSCPKSSSSCLGYTLTGTVTEHLKHGRVTGTSARADQKKTKKVANTKLVKVASASGSVSVANSKTLTIKLNGLGEALLKRFGKLRVSVSVTAGGKKVASATVTVTKAKGKTKK